MPNPQEEDVRVNPLELGEGSKFRVVKPGGGVSCVLERTHGRMAECWQVHPPRTVSLTGDEKYILVT